MTSGVLPYPIGFGAKSGIEAIRTNLLGTGIADVGVAHEGKIAIPIVMYSIDDFVAISGGTAPDYLKIDVDGIELDVIRGARRTLAKVREAQVELDVSQLRLFLELMAEAGLHPYAFSAKPDHVDPSRHDIFQGSTGETQVMHVPIAEVPFVTRGHRLGINTRFRRN